MGLVPDFEEQGARPLVHRHLDGAANAPVGDPAMAVGRERAIANLPIALEDLPAGEYDAAITMGCGDACPMVQARIREDWGIPDPKELPPGEFRAVRNLIENKVKDLLARLTS